MEKSFATEMWLADNAGIAAPEGIIGPLIGVEAPLLTLVAEASLLEEATLTPDVLLLLILLLTAAAAAAACKEAMTAGWGCGAGGGGGELIMLAGAAIAAAVAASGGWAERYPPACIWMWIMLLGSKAAAAV